jgi:hypothetical protein
LIEYLAKLPSAVLAAEPLRAAHRAQRKPAPRMRIMPQLQRVAVANGTHNVLALGIAYAV